MSEPWLTPTQCEEALEQKLHGRRLICEADLDEDLALQVKMRYSGLCSAQDAVFVAERYPLISAFFLVQRGVANYSGHDYWSGTSIRTRDQRRVGQAFEAVLRDFDLETFLQFFEAERARRFVSVILAHGGIPQSLAGRFLRECLLPALKRGEADSGADLVALWRDDAPSWFPSTVRRFLLHGGETATGLLDRLVNLATVPRAELRVRGDSFGVPRYFVDAFLEVPEADVARAKLWPRPRVEIDPWDGAGPILRLPPVGPEIAKNAHWQADIGKGQLRTVSGLWARDPDPIELLPDRYWSVEGSGDGAARCFRFEAFADNPVVCFDAAGRYLTDAAGIRADQAWILAAPEATVASVEGEVLRPLTPGEAGAPLSGQWTRHTLQNYDLHAVDVLSVSAPGHDTGLIRVLRETASVEFVSGQVRDVEGQGGEPVFDAPPSISLPANTAWRVVVSDPEGRAHDVAHAAAEVRRTIDLAELIDTSVGRYEMTVMGRLGEDVHTPFMVVPQLIAETPQHPMLSAAEIDIIVRADPQRVRLFDQIGGDDHVTVHEGKSRADLWVRDIDRRANRKLGLFVMVPRVRWAIATSDAAVPTFGQSVLALDPETVGTAAKSLEVRVERPGVSVRVALTAGGDQRISSDVEYTDATGRVSFELKRFRDAVRADREHELRLIASVALNDVIVASYNPPTKPAAHQATPVHKELPRLQSRVSATVVGECPDGIEVKGDVWTGVIPFRALPRARNSYRPGTTVEAWVARIDGVAHLLLDAREFDSARFPLGRCFEVRVRRITPEALYVDVAGYDGRIMGERLPLGRWIEEYRYGEVIEARVIDARPDTRRLELAVVPFSPAGLEPGTPFHAPVVTAREGGLILRLSETAVGLVPRKREADGPRRRVGEYCDGWIDHIDRPHETVYCTMRPFNEAGYAVEQEFDAVVTRPLPNIVLVRLPDGSTAGVPRSKIPMSLRLRRDRTGGRSHIARPDSRPRSGHAPHHLRRDRASSRSVCLWRRRRCIAVRRAALAPSGLTEESPPDHSPGIPRWRPTRAIVALERVPGTPLGLAGMAMELGLMGEDEAAAGDQFAREVLLAFIIVGAGHPVEDGADVAGTAVGAAIAPAGSGDTALRGPGQQARANGVQCREVDPHESWRRADRHIRIKPRECRQDRPKIVEAQARRQAAGRFEREGGSLDRPFDGIRFVGPLADLIVGRGSILALVLERVPPETERAGECFRSVGPAIGGRRQSGDRERIARIGIRPVVRFDATV